MFCSFSFFFYPYNCAISLGHLAHLRMLFQGVNDGTSPLKYNKKEKNKGKNY